MPQDAFTLRYVASELNDLLVGAKVNRINQPDLEEVVFHLYNKGVNSKLLISTNAVGARVSFTFEEKQNPLTAYGFCMLLRKYLLSAEIVSVEQVGFERIIKITFNALNDFFESRERVLYAEIMGKYSNVVLTENDKILGSLKAFSLDINSLRPLVSGMKYMLPPKQEKFLPSEEAWKAVLEQKLSALPVNGVDLTVFLSDFFFENIIGLSKPTALEASVSFFADNQPENLKNTDHVYRYLNEFVFNSDKKPCVKYSGSGNPKDFYPFNYRSVGGEVKYFDDVISAQVACYGEKERARQLGEAKRKLASIIKKTADKLKKREEIINKKEADCGNLEDNRLKGELLIANLYRLKDGQDFAEVENYYDGMTLVKIPLDKNESVKTNAENYFKRYNKQKRTLASLVPQREELEREKAYVKSLLAELEIADNLSDFNEIEQELKASGFIKAEKEKKKKAIKTRFTTYIVEGYTVKVGKSNVQNDELISTAHGGCMWLHSKNYHSSHVIIEYMGEEFPESVIKTSAEICAYYSEARDGGKTEIDYTKRKFVKKPPKANLGFVTYTNQQTIIVTPDKHEELLVKRG